MLTGGLLPAIGYVRQYQTWGNPLIASRSDAIDLKLTNVASLTVSPGRAQTDCAVKLNVSSDGPVAVTLAGCHRTEHFG